jgi:hypothetical protein
MRVLEKYGVPPHMIRMIVKLYEDNAFQLTVGDTMVEILQRCGVKQGDNMAPVLFLFLMHALAEVLDQEWQVEKLEFRHHKHRDRKPLSRLKAQPTGSMGVKTSFYQSLFVDDGVFLFNNRQDLEWGTQALYNTFDRFGLDMHIGRNGKESKTEIVYFPPTLSNYLPVDKSPVPVADGAVTFTEKFKYLGTWITHDLKDDKEVSVRIARATGVLTSMREILHCPWVDLEVKKSIYTTWVLPIILWGCETWAITAKIHDKLKAFHHRSLRWIMRMSYLDCKERRWRNEETRMKIGVHDISTYYISRQLKFISKTACLTETHPTRQLLLAWTSHPRRFVHPQTSVRDTFTAAISHIQPSAGAKGLASAWLPSARIPEEWASKTRTWITDRWKTQETIAKDRHLRRSLGLLTAVDAPDSDPPMRN